MIEPGLLLQPVFLLHIPDGFLSLPISALMYVISIGFVAFAVWRTNRTLNERTVPLMGVLAAFIFAAQMMNFPVAGGSSGHLLGGALAAILLGPWTAVLVLTVVVSTQALIFQDGGVGVLGANVFNMAILGVFVGYGVFRLGMMLAGGRRSVMLASALAAGWASMMAGALSVSVQLALSGTSPWQIVVPAMLGIHALLGFVDGIITAGALAFILYTRPDLLRFVVPQAARATVVVEEGVAR
jgi:cobalt/nickel transport system permease protein